MKIDVRLEHLKDLMFQYPVVYLAEHGSVIFHPKKTTGGMKTNRTASSWAKYLTKQEIISAVGFATGADYDENEMLERVVNLLEANSPCDDTEIVALRSGLVQKITYTDE